MEVKRLGGAFGCKISRTSLVACACSLAAYLLNKPVKMVVNMEATMKAIGKRCPIYVSYESQSTPGTALHDQRISTNYMVVLHVNSMNFTWNHGLHGSTINFNFRRAGVSSKGVIQSLDINMYGDMGISLNDATWIFVNDGISNAYDTRSFKFNFFGVKTDNPASVWTRAPGTLESMTTIEHIMEHIAQVTGLAPIDVRLANVSSEFKDTMNEMVSTLKKSSDFDKRVQSAHNFNEENRWKKRGLSMVIMKYGIIFVVPYYATVSIYPGDGSVVITSGGIEMGQGLNTKAAQVCAYAFGIELEMVKVISSLSFTSPGNAPTGGSITSDAVCAAVLNCCEELNSRLGPIKEKMKNPAWPAVVQAANMAGLKLIASHATNNSDPIPQPYPVFGATVTEVEVDILTGQYQILRADILEDAGESMNPSVDIGQIEGAFTMGLGYFGSEELKYEPKTGYNLTHRTWDYYPPGFKDIPIDFRITLRKNAPNPVGVLRSKSAGEPPICMSYSLPLAIRQAVASARKDTGLKDEWFTFNPPCTFEKTYLAAGTVPKDFTL